MNQNKSKGLRYEQQAKQYLTERGLICLTQNYQCRFGEIDLIMRDDDIVSFIEVKFRRSLDFGGAIGAITRKKQQKIVKTAQTFMQQNQKFGKLGMRFDAIILQQTSEQTSIDWIQNAFYADAF